MPALLGLPPAFGKFEKSMFEKSMFEKSGITPGKNELGSGITGAGGIDSVVGN